MKRSIQEVSNTLGFSTPDSKYKCVRTTHNIITTYSKTDIRNIIRMLAEYVEAEVSF